MRIVEIAQFVAAPMATLVLCDLGAEVVKIETGAKGDDFRTYGLRHNGFSAFWVSVNRGKRSVALDLKDSEAQARCHDLIRRADAVLISSRPGALDDIGLSDDVLASLKAALVRVYVTGYGQTGPRAQEPVFDSLIQAMTGMAVFQGDRTAPELVAPMAADKVTAMMVAQAMLAGLFESKVRGTGRRIDVSLLDATAYWNFPDLYQDRTFAADERRLSRLASPIVRTSDGFVAVAPVTGKQIGKAAAAFGHPEWVADLKQIADHTVMTRELYRLVNEVTSRMTGAEVMALMATAGVPTAPVHDLDEHLSEPQVLHNELYEVVDDERVGPVRTVRYPAVFDGEHRRAPFTAPAYGDDTEAVLREWLADS